VSALVERLPDNALAPTAGRLQDSDDWRQEGLQAPSASKLLGKLMRQQIADVFEAERGRERANLSAPLQS
jgi:hypothetical protein